LNVRYKKLATAIVLEACPEKKLNEDLDCTIRITVLISGLLQGRNLRKANLKALVI
jgi:hypothetical protein